MVTTSGIAWGKRVFAASVPILLLAGLFAVGNVGASAPQEIEIRKVGETELLNTTNTHPLGPTQAATTLQLTVRNLHPDINPPPSTADDAGINKIRFTVNANYEAPKKVGDPYLLLSGPVFELGSSRAFGWTVEVKNTYPTHQVIFTAKPGHGIHSAQEKDVLFTIGYKMDGTKLSALKDGDMFNAKVKSDYAGGGSAKEYDFKFEVDTDQPDILKGTGTAGIVTRDLDKNGHIDQVVLTYDDKVDEDTFKIGAFQVGGSAEYEITKADFDLIEPGDDLFPVEPWFGKCPETPKSKWGCSQVRLFLIEGQEFDTGHLPATINPSSATVALPMDEAGNEAKGITATSGTEVDGAYPIIVSALAFDTENTETDFEEILVTFSEPVNGDNGTAAITAQELSYADTPAGAGRQQFQDPPLSFYTYPNVTAIKHPPVTGGDKKFAVVQFQNPNGNPATFAGPALKVDDAPAKSPQEALIDGDADLIGCRIWGGAITIADLSKTGPGGKGLPCQSTGFGSASPLMPVLTPTLLEASVNIGAGEAVLRFNVGVEDAFTNGDITSATGAFDLIPTQSAGVTGVKEVHHKRCTKEVKLILKGTVKPTDVDTTPSKINLETGKIQGCSLGGKPGDIITSVPVPLRDYEAPTITELKTVDRDSNGVVDGFSVIMSEPVQDITFCGGSNPCPVGGLLELRDPSNVFDLTGYGSFTWDTGRDVDDREGILSWSQNSLDVLEPLLTGFVPDLISDAGLFQDRVPSTVSVNLMDVVSSEDVREIDRAPPVLLRARTLDTNTQIITDESKTGCMLNKDPDCTVAPNGFIDAYELSFTEPVLDTTVFALEWKVDGRQLVLDPTDSTKRRAQVHNGLRGSDAINDETLILSFEEIMEDEDENELYGDTGVVPELSYGILAATGGLRDRHGNSMAGFTVDDIEEVDGARPVITVAEGFEGDTKVKVIFSEPVDDGLEGGLVRGDFAWKNQNGRDVSGIVSSPQVEHDAGDQIAILHLDQPLTKEDIEGVQNSDAAVQDRTRDRVAAFFDPVGKKGAVYEVSPLAETEQSVLGTAKRLREAIDLIPPGPIRDLNHTLIGANFLRFEWTAPADDDLNGTPVTGYWIKVSTDPLFGFTGLDEDDNPGHQLPTYMSDDNIVFDPADLAVLGDTQEVIISGLLPETKYHIGIVGYDDAGLTSTSPGIITRTTNIDKSAPSGQLNLAVVNAQGGKTSDMKLELDWSALDDEESVVVYKYALSKNSDIKAVSLIHQTTETEADIEAQGRGEWFVHLQGFSGVPGPAQTLLINITPELVDASEAARYASNFNDPRSDNHTVVIKRVGNANHLNWTLPSPAPGDLEGVEVWRLDSGAWTLVGTVKGEPSKLRNGGFTDDTPGNGKKSRYFVSPVYAIGQSAGEPTVAADGATPVLDAGSGIAWWVWLLLSLGVLLLAGAVVLLVVLRGRTAQQSAFVDHAEGWSEVGEEAGVPTHEIDCPQCNTHFQATGHLPMPIKCPECGVSGKLE